MTHGIAIFVKTPGLSPIKTRLAASAGAERALAIYRASIECVRASVDLACRQVDLTAYWAVAEPQGSEHWSGWPCLLQPDGALGTRMASIHAQLRARHDSALLLGADVPGISAELIADACRALDGAPARVIAPASDGGFVLFGANADLGADSWDQPNYGAAATAEEFLAVIGADLRLATLETQLDLDTHADLVELQSRRPALPTPQQVEFWSHLESWTQVLPGCDPGKPSSSALPRAT